MTMISYAQNFEDVMLWRALGHVDKGFYIDIGAQDPVVDSVSLAFYEKGWRGIHVEPTPHYADLLRKERPEDSVIQAAVGTSKGFLRFFEIPDTGISTADATIAAQHIERGFKLHEITVPSISLASIFGLCKHREIHWLKIDVEGFESQVLSSWGRAAARPWIVIVESTLPLTQIESHAKWEKHLVKHGYNYVYFDGLNRFYVSEQRPELKSAFRSGPNVFDGFVFNGTGSAPFWSLIEKRHQIELVEKAGEFDENAKRLQSQIQALAQARSERELELEGKQNESLSQLQQRNLECNEAQVRNEQLTALLQARESELHQAAISSAHFESELQTSLLKVSEASRAELASITQQFVQNAARFSSDLNTQIERNISLNTELNSERIKANAANEAVNAARAEASHSKDLHAQKEEALGRNLAAEKARNESLEKQWQSEKTKNGRHELELAAYRETTLRQVETISQKDKVFATELNNYRERVSALERELRDEKTANENQAATNQAFAKDAEQALGRLTVRIGELDMIVSQQATHITDIEQQNLLGSQHHKRSISTAEDKIAELTRERQLSLTRLGEQKHVLSQLEQTLAALNAELQHVRATYTWRFTSPFRWVKSVLFGDAKPSDAKPNSLNVVSAPIAFQPLPVATEVVSNESTMPPIDIQMKIFEPEISEEIVSDSTNSNELFISRTYKNLLGREPEPIGAALYLDRLNNNVPRETVFREIQMSEEAKSYSLAVELARITALNAHVEDLDAEALLAKHDKAFVVAAYQQLLKRNPDVAGYSSYLHALRSGVSKLQILDEIRNSAEGSIHNQSPRGLEDLIRGREREKIFFFGRIFKVFSNINRIQSMQNALQRIESQIIAKRSDDIEQYSQHASRLREADIAMRALIDKKITGLISEVGSQLLKTSEQNRQRFEDIDVALDRQSVVLQRAAIDRRLKLVTSAISNDEHVSAVFNELKTAIASKKGMGNENSN
jgi:FkbM family methyltransferase